MPYSVMNQIVNKPSRIQEKLRIAGHGMCPCALIGEAVEAIVPVVGKTAGPLIKGTGRVVGAVAEITTLKPGAAIEKLETAGKEFISATGFGGDSTLTPEAEDELRKWVGDKKYKVLSGMPRVKNAIYQAQKDLHDLMGQGCNPWENEWKLMHCLHTCHVQKECGVLATFVIPVAGVVYEQQTASGQWQGDPGTPNAPGKSLDGQSFLSWLYDTPGDIIANTWGQICAFLPLSCKDCCMSAHHCIPGPAGTKPKK